MGIGQQSCLIACVGSASMRWPAKMREAGDAKLRPRNEANSLGNIIQLTASALLNSIISITILCE